MGFAAELEDATRPRTRRCRTAGQGRGRVFDTPHARHDPGCLRAQERRPRLRRALGCGVDPHRAQDRGDRRCGDLDAERRELAMDPTLIPRRVLGGETNNRRSDLSSGRGRAHLPVRVRPMLGDKTAMPGQARDGFTMNTDQRERSSTRANALMSARWASRNAGMELVGVRPRVDGVTRGSRRPSNDRVALVAPRGQRSGGRNDTRLETPPNPQGQPPRISDQHNPLTSTDEFPAPTGCYPTPTTGGGPVGCSSRCEC
jgi:hypothetical protein